jgi:hypothetical protein
MITIFDNISRDFFGSSDMNEPTYNYYNRSARKDINIIRNTLENWFSEIPESEKHSMKSSFKRSFDDTFYELFLYNLFKKLGYDIKIHPSIEGTTKKPDFLISKDDIEIYIEAKISKDKTSKEEALEKMTNQFYDSINKLRSNNFMLGINEVSFISGRQPKTRKIVQELEKKLSELDPDVVEKAMKKNGFDIFQIKYEDEDIFVVFNPLPVVSDARSKKNRRPIGIFPAESFWGGGEDAIKDAIEVKANRYGKLNKPYIVCINALGKKTTSRNDADDAIWGSLAVSFSENPDDRDEKLVRSRNGIFLDEKGPRKRNVSGVLITQIYPHGIPNSKYWLYENPFAVNKLDWQKIGLIYNYVKDGYIYSFDGEDLDRILEMDKNWLK